MIDPALLRSFRAVARARSFSAAARGLRLGQPAISQHIRRLEEQLGRRLFVRDTHSVHLTPDGEAMVAFADNILDANDLAERYFLSGRVRGRLQRALGELAVTIGRTATVVAQARSRLAGQMPDGATRLVSLHDPDARPIRKGAHR
jgi:DNA-binding transcriptional LysR family regulator